MVRSFLVIIFFCFYFTINLSHADFLGFKTESPIKSKIPVYVEQLKKMKIEMGPVFEDNFNQIIKGIEHSIEEEKLVCSGESSAQEGKTFKGKEKSLCFKELKNNYLEGIETIFELKKKYLVLIHQDQLEKLTQIQKKIKIDVDKNF